jgi:hypothetical protein
MMSVSQKMWILMNSLLFVHQNFKTRAKSEVGFGKAVPTLERFQKAFERF